MNFSFPTPFLLGILTEIICWGIMTIVGKTAAATIATTYLITSVLFMRGGSMPVHHLLFGIAIFGFFVSAITLPVVLAIGVFINKEFGDIILKEKRK